MQDILKQKDIPNSAGNLVQSSTQVPTIIGAINSSLTNTLSNSNPDFSTENVLALELGLNSRLNSDGHSNDLIEHHHISKHNEEQIENIRREAAKHAGHENQHLAMILILIFVMLISQILLVWWKTKYQKSYIHTSMVAMYIIPFGISVYRHWWRFVSIWLVISAATIALVWRPLLMPNFSNRGSTIPRLLYKWFFMVYSISSIVAVTGYSILVLTFFGINILLNVTPQTALDIGFMMLFYGIYYGVLCRDFTDFLVDKLAAQIGYYNPSSALPSKLLKDNVCAICGMDHGDKENIDLDGLSKNNEPLLSDSASFFDNEHSLNPDQETLIEYGGDENASQKERIFVLTCGHKFHEYCIYGWCLIGKRQVCPFCREKVDLNRLFSSLIFQKPHYLYGNLLDFIRYLFAWQPIIFFAVHFLDYELGLE